MAKLLHVDSSILGQTSVSRLLSQEIVIALRDAHPGLEIIRQDLASRPLGHLSPAHMAAFQGASPEEPSAREDISAGEQALEAFLAADIVVVGAPMYNFGVPSQLKAWIDRLAVAGRTFRYTEAGVVGLAGGKRLFVASSRGGVYTPGSPMGALDHQETYLRGVFGFFGVTDITFIRAEGVALGEAARHQAIEAAQSDIRAAIA